MSAFSPVGIIHADARGKVWPAIPFAFLDCVEIIGIIYHVARAALVHSMFGGKELPFFREGQAVRVT